ncbi:MAG: hypothetical protein ACYC2I_04485 [Elusimicrobiales bacterium]
MAMDGGYPAGWPRAAALLVQLAAAGLLLKARRFGAAAAAGLLLAGFLPLYRSASDIGGKSVHYRNYNSLGSFRAEVALEEKASGRRPADLSGVKAPVLAVKNGHSRTREVKIFRLPPEAYTLRVPAGGGYSSVKGYARGRDGAKVNLAYDEAYPEQSQSAVLLYPGQEYSFELTGVPAGGRAETLISSGTVSVPEVPGFEKDTGTWVYDPDAGHVFINCTHEPEYKKGWLWWAL